MPSFSLIFFSISSAVSGFSLRWLRAFSFTLTELIALVGVPGSRLTDEALSHAEVDQRTLLADAMSVEDVELGLLERRRHLCS